MQNRDKVYCSLASMFGVGKTPGMPGTAACLVALPIFAVIRDQALFAVVAVAVTIIAFIVCTPAEKIFGGKDPKIIVIDDFAGMLLTFLFIPFSVKLLVIGFFLFRMLDMLKVFPANLAEELPGAGGIVGDDVVAGILANIVLHLALRFAGI